MKASDVHHWKEDARAVVVVCISMAMRNGDIKRDHFPDLFVKCRHIEPLG